MKKYIYFPLVFSMYPVLIHASDIDDLLNIDLASLSMLDVEMESASKTSQKLSDIPSSVFVLNNERIKRSGYDTVAELMSLVPGFFSAKYNEQGYEVSTRGFHDGLYNKMLVLVDGRSVFSPMYGGVYWSDLDYLINDIEKIEVLKGPGGTMWGANSANGVVNIITKSAQATVGGYVEASIGRYDEHQIALRYGHDFDNDLYARVFFQQRKVPLTLDNSGYERRSELLGLVLETYNINNKWTFRLGGERSNYNEDYYLSYDEVQTISLDSHSFYAQINNQYTQLDGSVLNSSFSINYDEDDDLFASGNYTTYDLDVNYHFFVNEANRIITGIGGRYLSLNFEKGISSVYDPTGDVVYGFTEDSTISDMILNAYIQAQTQWTHAFSSVVGIKAEYLQHSDQWAYSPQVRGLYKFNAQHSVWSGFTQSHMLPSYFDTDTNWVSGDSINRPNPDLNNESVSTVELGYRFTPSYRFDIDLTLFISDYDNLRSFYYSDEMTDNGYYITDVTDDYVARTKGVEIASHYKHNDRLNFYFGYSYLEVDAECDDGISTDECSADYDLDVDSQHLANIQMLWTINNQWQLDIISKYQAMHFSEEADLYYGYDNYISLDARLAWQYNKKLPMIEIIAQNIGSNPYADSWRLYENESQIRARASLEF